MSDRKAGATAARRGGIGVDHAERGADQVVDEINLGARQKRHRGGIDQHHRIVALDHQVIIGLRALDVEFVLKAGAATTSTLMRSIAPSPSVLRISPIRRAARSLMTTLAAVMTWLR